MASTKLHLPAGWHWLLACTGTVSGELCWLGTPWYSTEEGECLHPEQALWTSKLKQKTGCVGEELPICTARQQGVKRRLNTTEKFILGQLAIPGLRHLQSHIAADKVHFIAITKPAGWSELCTLPRNLRGVCTIFGFQNAVNINTTEHVLVLFMLKKTPRIKCKLFTSHPEIGMQQALNLPTD